MDIKRIGVALKEGCCIEGADKAIDALEVAGLDFSAVLTVNHSEETYPKELLHLPEIVDINKRLKSTVEKVLSNNDFPLVMGGDHSLAIGSIAAHSSEDLVVLWVDAHGDCNTDKSTITGRIHGMPLAVLNGHGAKPLVDIVDNNFLLAKNVIIFGVRSLDALEEEYIKEWGINVYTIDDIREKGFAEALAEVLAIIGERQLHLSFDLDCLEPSIIKGVNTPAGNGLSIIEGYTIIQETLSKCEVVAMDIVEFNPTRDDGTTQEVVLEIDRLVQELIK